MDPQFDLSTGKPEIVYPCRWEYKTIGADEDEMRAAIAEIVVYLDHSLSSSNTSRTGRYCSLLLAVTVRSESHRNEFLRPSRNIRISRRCFSPSLPPKPLFQSIEETMTEFRIEHDTMGEVRLPAAAYYGAQTQRAVENFPISGRTLPAGTDPRLRPGKMGCRHRATATWANWPARAKTASLPPRSMP